MNTVDIVECPRDAWQSLHDFIPTEKKVAHIAFLMSCGFHTIDAGSFVSPKAMPQMADAAKLFAALEPLKEKHSTRLLAIVANEGGAKRASAFPFIDAWGYPFSVSEMFQKRNSRKNIAEAIEDLKRVKERADRAGAELVVYLSMALGNPYDEVYDLAILEERMHQAVECGANLLSLSDTTGQGTVEKVGELSSWMAAHSPRPWGAHLHSTYDEAGKKALAAIENGCRRLDTALKGFGGCPFASDTLVGNMPTEKVMTAIEGSAFSHQLQPLQLERAYNSALDVFANHI